MIEYEKPKPKRLWQNLFYSKCPKCSTKMEDSKDYMSCLQQNKDEPGKNCFFIKKEKIAEMLLDTTHPANFCLTSAERERIDEMLEKMGLEYEDD